MNSHNENDKPNGTVTIIVNGRPKELPKKDDLTFAEIVDIAFPGQTQAGNICFTVTYKRGQGGKPEGTLVQGQSVKIKDRMVFNVTRTDKS